MNIDVIRDLTQPMRHIVHVRNHLLAADGRQRELELGGGGVDDPALVDITDRPHLVVPDRVRNGYGQE